MFDELICASCKLEIGGVEEPNECIACGEPLCDRCYEHSPYCDECERELE